MSLVKCSNIGTLYLEEADNPNSALKGIFVENLEISAGGITAIMGPSGSGKSTLLSVLGALKSVNCVSRSEAASRIDLFEGTDDATSLLHDGRTRAGSVSYVFQDSHLMKAMPAGMNLEMAHALRFGRLEADTIGQAMEEFRFTDGTPTEDEIARFSQKPVQHLSGGQQQRIAVGRALLSQPRLIFCDEPTSSLDGATAHSILNSLSDWVSATGGSVIWVTHDEDLALRFADNYVYIAAGRVFSDGGRPIPIDKNLQIEARKAELEEIKAAIGDIRHFTLDDLDARKIQFQASSEDIKFAATPMLEGGKRMAFRTGAIFRYLMRFVGAELFDTSPGRRLPHRPDTQDDQRWRSYLRAPLHVIKIFTKPAFALILLLGLITAYGTLVGGRALEQAFARSLSLPEVAHFVMTNRGSTSRDGDTQLSNARIEKLETDLTQEFFDAKDAGTTAPAVFGRRFDLLATVGPASGTSCDGTEDRKRTSAMLVFQQKEPLYAALKVTSPSGETRAIADFDRQDLQGSAIVTRAFLERVLGVTEGDPWPEGFCFRNHHREFVKIAGVVKSLAGSEDRQFEFAFTNRAYLRFMSNNPPNSWEGKRPPFQLAALYFDASYAEDLFCKFDACEGKEELFEPVFGSAFKLNDDTLEQIKRLIGIAIGGRSVLYAVVALMAVLVVTAVALSVIAFIGSNQRILCIMRAVGYQRRHIASLLSMELLGILAVAAVPFFLCVALFHAFAAPWLTAQFDLEPGWLAWSLPNTALAIGACLIIVICVGLSVLFSWWRSNRDIGYSLQGL